MRISFDVDDTLVLHGVDGPMEPGLFPAFLHRRLTEPLRLGAVSLIRKLRRQGHEVWIYTSSVRTSFHLRKWLFLHGLGADGIVNEERHRLEMERRHFVRSPSKYPPAFGINLHIDDSEGVRMEAAEHRFRVVMIHPNDVDWTRKVLAAVDLA